ncbi:chemotaxis protein methyltransferase CheR [Candidatus Magnetomoraceae bacterium gMMP-15]
MNNYNPNTMSEIMSDKLFKLFSDFIKKELGIKMPSAKKNMLQARLQKRMRQLELNTFEEYYDYLFSTAGMKTELLNMINVVTTNKTDFFREPKHFEFLVQDLLPELMERNRGLQKKFIVWSAGCSSGEEPYTLSMFLNKYAEKYPEFHYQVFATDISTTKLEEAKLGIYEHEKIEPVPMNFRRKYFLKSKNKNKGLVRVAPEIRSTIRFGRLNFMDEDYGNRQRVDIIFCRNVIIYFDRTTQQAVLSRLCKYLKPGGYMFMGHSETLNALKLPLVQIVSTVYKKL